MFKKVKRFLVGDPLSTDKLQGEKYGVMWGLPILSSDAISSVAYAGQEMLIVLLPIVGVLAFKQMTILSGAIIALMLILVFSYRQTIQNYPNGGGSYIVSKENLGVLPGLVAGAALSIDYILTVAVSVSSGVEQISSAFRFLKPYSVPITVALILLIMLGNLRGIREASKIFGIPTYAFIFALGSMIVAGFYRVITGNIPAPAEIINTAAQPVTIFLMLKAFSSGCTALTGVEAVSNAVPNFKNPPTKHAKKVLSLMAVVILFLFGGTSILANFFQVDPRGGRAVLVLMAEQIFGGGSFMYFFLTATTFLILILAANTAYADFPMLISVVSKDGYAPRQLHSRGDKLAFDNGILVLSAVSIILVIAFKAEVTLLISLYAVGVFISFTLSQSGMFARWLKHRGKHWQIKALINGFGAVVTFVTAIIIAVEKFKDGAYLVVFLIPILVFLMYKTKKHYDSVKTQLKLSEEDYHIFNKVNLFYRNHIIVPIESINQASIRALRYALSISEKPNIRAFTVAIDEEAAQLLKEQYKKFQIGIPLKIVYSPYRKILEPLLAYIESEELGLRPGEMVTVVLPKFKVKKWWHNIMHNNTTRSIEKELLKHRQIVVSIIPLQLEDDNISEIPKSKRTNRKLAEQKAKTRGTAAENPENPDNPS
jgi:amino acid transporter